MGLFLLVALNSFLKGDESKPVMRGNTKTGTVDMAKCENESTWMVPHHIWGVYLDRYNVGGTRGRDPTVTCLAKDNGRGWNVYLASKNTKVGIYTWLGGMLGAWIK